MNNQSVTLKLPNTGDFATFGQSIVAYVKKVDVCGLPAYAIHGANGEPLGIEPSEQMAVQALQQRNLFPVMLQ